MPTECERSVASLAVEQQQQQQQQQQFELGADEELQQQQQQQQPHEQLDQQLFQNLNDKMESSNIISKEELLNGEMSTSQTSTTSSNDQNGGGIGSSNGSNGIGKKTSITSPDPTAYVAKARVTRPTPPPPSYNPMQFVQIKPCNLYQTAQQQLKKAEEVKKIKEIKKEEPEDWQNNLDNWKSSRRKRVEHIIDRVVEVKKLELEEHDRSRRKSKTFSEMIEERGERPLGRGRTKLALLAVYKEDEANDLSDLGIGTSSASGKSSQSEDYDNNSVLSDNAELDKAIFENNHKPTNSIAREYISSPGYDTSSSTAPGSSPDPCEYTYEGAIQDYKQRVSRATGGTAGAGLGAGAAQGGNYNKNGHSNNNNNNNNMKVATTTTTSKESTPERGGNKNGGGVTETYPTRRGSKIEDRLIGFEVTSPSDSQEGVEKQKVDVPKIDISKRKEIFENQNANSEPKSVVGNNGSGGNGGSGVPKVTLRDRFKLDSTASSSSSSSGSSFSNNNSNNNEVQERTTKKEVKRLSGDITSIRDRLQSLEQQQNLVNSTSNTGSGNAVAKLSTAKSVDVAVLPLKDRLNSLQNAVTKEEIKKPPVVLIDARQLEIMKCEEETAKQRKKQKQLLQAAETQATKDIRNIKSKPLSTATPSLPPQAPPPPLATTALEIIESIEAVAESEVDRDDSGIHTSDDIELNEERMAEFKLQNEQEEQLNAAIAALAMEERQLEEAANAVNQIEAEFAELSTASPTAVASSNTAGTSTTNNNNEQQQQQLQPPCEMEFSVSSTNKSNPSSSSSYIISSSNGSCNIGYNDDNIIGRDNEVASPTTPTCKMQNDKATAKVSGNCSDNNVNVNENPANACNLRRKPSNEMVHARNLLKMFKETFNNDIELDEEPEDAAASTETKRLPKPQETKAGEAKGTEVKATESKAIESKATEAKTLESKFQEPKSLELKYPEPMSPELKSSGPKSREPKSLEPRSPEPKSLELKSQEPKSPEPKLPESKSLEPKSPDPKVTLPIQIPITPMSAVSRHSFSPMSPITIETQIFQARTPTPPPSTTSPFNPFNRTNVNSPHSVPPSPPTRSPGSIAYSMIPRSLNNPAGKPPMSPKSVRHAHPKLTTESPLSSPTPVRKTSDSQFSINGRVEIFNSKNMMNSDNTTTTTTTMPTTKKSTTATVTYVVPHLTESTAASSPTSPHGKPEAQTLSNNANNNIELLRQKQQWQQQHQHQQQQQPKQQQSQQHHHHQQQQQQQHHRQSPTALPSVTEVLSISNQTKIFASDAKSMPAARSVNEPTTHSTRLLTNQQQRQHPPSPTQPQSHQQQSQTEIVICAPPVTIINPDELPKPNTVKTLSSCFSSHAAGTPNSSSKMTPPSPTKPLPKPLPRSRIPQTTTTTTTATTTTPPQSPTPAKRNYMSSGNLPPVMSKQLQKATTPELLRNSPFVDDVVDSKTQSQLTLEEDKNKKLSVISNASTMSTDSLGRRAGPFETIALVHSPPISPRSQINANTTTTATEKVLTDVMTKKPLALQSTNRSDPLKPNDILTTPTLALPSEIPPLLLCAPNESSLYKLASSAPASPSVSPKLTVKSSAITAAPTSPPPPSDADIALCSDFFSSFAPTKAFLAAERQVSVNEFPCDKIDVTDLPADKRVPSTRFSDISPIKVQKCDAGEKQKLKDFLAERQKRAEVEELPCKRIDVKDLPQPDYLPSTGYTAITKEDLKHCDGPYSLSATPLTSTTTPKTPNSNPNSKPNSPIMEARAAHSKALIETCEKIIAEERHACNQMKSSLPSSPKTTPQLQRKSKLPKPIPCCIGGGSDSMSRSDYEIIKPTATAAVATSSGGKTNSTSTSEPSTPNSVNDENLLIARLHVVETAIKVTTTTPPTSPKLKETKAAPPCGGKKKNIFDFLKKNFTHHDDTSSTAATQQPAASTTVGDPAATSSTSPQNIPSGSVVVPVDTVKIDEIITIDNSKFYIPSDDIPPPPLPSTPAPVNIEIIKTITTDELMESNSEKALTQEINDMLDDELNKLSLESGTLNERGDKLTGK